MATATATTQQASRAILLQSAIDQLSALELAGGTTIPPSDLVLLISDLCIETRCKFEDLPRSLKSAREDANNRIHDPNHGTVDFLTHLLIDSIERELRTV